MDHKLIILCEGQFSPLKSKTANAAIIYFPQNVLAIIDSTKSGKTSHDILGYGGAIPIVSSIDEALKFNPTALLIGIAPIGGRLPEAWRSIIITALKNKLHILSGLHTFLGDDSEFNSIAKQNNVSITDWRKIPEEYEVVSLGNWKTRKAKTILSVGMDCNIGKMTTTLNIHNEFLKRGLKSDFVATGQTGIMIRGRGIAVDSVISDYIAGSIEKVIDESANEGNDFIFVEGQGAITHQGYSGVTLGLIHGTMPDAFILCHQPARKNDDYNILLPDINRVIKLHEEIVGIFKKTKVICVGINSIGLTDEESMKASEKIENETGLPAIDTFRFGAKKLADAVYKYCKT
ncbi:MAG: DUF1611 domain-containing protein [Bacteroidetes bacterium]|nr:DUF1611 domain-containing protein [Bacteroidota bacterium]